MRTVHAVLLSIVTLVVLPTAQARAKDSPAQSADERSSPSACHSLEKSSDGAWVEIPCQELGSPAAARPRPESRNTQHASHP